ncbi:ABC transporter ATP-binding protein [Planctomycetota bacterium]
MSHDNPIVQMSRISKRFKRIQALDHIDLDIVPGHIIGLLGANGSGKSTLIRHIIGLYLPDTGACTTFGCAAADLTPRELGRIGYVHQNGELLDWMKVDQLIRYVSAYYPTWNSDLQETYVKDFELPLKQRVGSLSPGQRQKLAILLAIGFDPEFLILDEPAAGLDPLSRANFLDLLLQIIQDDERTILISSHILSDVEKVIDHAIMMDRGHILIDESFDTLRERYVRCTLTSLNGPLPEVLPYDNVIDCQRSGMSAQLILENASAQDVHKRAEALHCEVELKSLPLEDIYCVVMKKTR